MQNKTLDQLREEIDTVDLQIVSLLAKRMDLVRKVGEYKSAHALPPLDEKRWNALIERLKREAQKQNLSASLLEKIYNEIHKNALEIEHNK